MLYWVIWSTPPLKSSLLHALLQLRRLHFQFKIINGFSRIGEPFGVQGNESQPNDYIPIARSSPFFQWDKNFVAQENKSQTEDNISQAEPFPNSPREIRTTSRRRSTQKVRATKNFIKDEMTCRVDILWRIFGKIAKKLKMKSQEQKNLIFG